MEFWKITKAFKNGNIVIQCGYDAPIKGTKEELEKILLQEVLSRPQ
jgi:predicted small metal-binding protein